MKTVNTIKRFILIRILSFEGKLLRELLFLIV